MGGSGLIFAAIFSAWAVVLVPHWLRRRGEESHESGGGLALSRRVARSGRVTRSRRDAAQSDYSTSAGLRLLPWGRTPSSKPDERKAAAMSHISGADSSHRSGSSTAVARRRQILLVLLLATGLTGILVVAGPALGLTGVDPGWLAPPTVLLVGYVGLLAATRGLRSSKAGVRGAPSIEVPADGEGSAAAQDEDAPGVDPADEQLAAASDPRVVDSAADLAPTPTPAPRGIPPEAGPTWTPVPVPLPAYVNAPRAPASVRTIDLSADGPWSVGSVEAQTAGHDLAHDVADDVADAEAENDTYVSRRAG